jgi:predicted Zn-dependent peptidase
VTAGGAAEEPAAPPAVHHPQPQAMPRNPQPLAAQERPTDVLNVPAQRHRLPNGLRVTLSVDRSNPIVAVNLWYAVGSRNERPGRTGFAHLFEHMMFQGSANVPKNRHFELIEGAGGSLNASTWFDRTNYYETLPAHQLELALWLEADRMGWMLPAMTAEKLQNQQQVVMNERKQRYDNQPYGDWDERMQALVFPSSHPYHHPVIGSMEDIAAATLDDVADFFRTFYVPNNAVLTLAGDLDPAWALELVVRYFGPIPPGGPLPPLPGTPGPIPLLGGTARQEVVADVPLPRVYLGARVPAVRDSSFHVAEVAATVLGTGHSSRLYRSLVRERKVAKDVLSYLFPLETGASLLLFWITGYPGADPAALERALVEEVEGLATVTQAELDRAVAMTETHLVREIQRVGERADLLSMFDQVFDDPARLNSEVDRVRAVTRAQVEGFAGSFLGSENRAILTYRPGGGA